MTATIAESPLSPLRAVSYVRVSTLDQARRGAEPEGLSIPAQREANRRRALEVGALVVAEFVERGRSGTSIERPELQRMLEYIQNRPVDFVIGHKIDRLARNRADDTAITKTIQGAGAYLVSMTEAISTTPSGWLLHGIMASIAEFYSQNFATEVPKGMRQKAIQGGTPGRAPLGYFNERRIGDGRTTRASSSMVSNMPRHEPLIDPVTWASVQDSLTSRRNGERSRAHDHYLKGTVFCLECGRRLIVQHTRTKTGRIYEYFVCHRRRDVVCQQRKALPIGKVEQRVEDLYRVIELNPDQSERIEQTVLATLHRRQSVNDERIEEIAKETQTAQANRTKLLDAYYADAIPRDLFLSHQRRLNTELASLDREKAKRESTAPLSSSASAMPSICCKMPMRPSATRLRRCGSS